MHLLSFVCSRLVSALLTLLVMGGLIFVLVAWLPGDVCLSTLGQDVQDSSLAACRHYHHLDQPGMYRFGQWLKDLAAGDAGQSMSRHRPAMDVLEPRLKNTLFLAFLAAAIGFPLALLTGLLSGWYRKRWLDGSVSVISLLCMSLPEFVMALPLIWLFSYKLGWLPSVVFFHADQSWLEKLQMTLLPAMTLALVMNAHIMCTVRASARKVCHCSFVQMARLKGLGEGRVLLGHGLKSVISPCVGTFTLFMAWLFSGVVVTEKVFNYPGLGYLMVSSIQDRDYPMVQISAMSITLLCVICSVTGDLISVWLNPVSRGQSA